MWEGREESERVGFALTCRPDRRWSLFYENRYELNQKVPYYQHLRGSYRFTEGPGTAACGAIAACRTGCTGTPPGGPAPACASG